MDQEREKGSQLWWAPLVQKEFGFVLWTGRAIQRILCRGMAELSRCFQYHVAPVTPSSGQDFWIHLAYFQAGWGTPKGGPDSSFTSSALFCFLGLDF